MPTRFFSSRGLASSFLAVLTLHCASDPPVRGALMLSVATDMAVPNDIDRIVWSITLDGEATPYATNSVELAGGSDLPMTLTIEAGPKASAPITVKIEGTKGAGPSVLRVSREAKVVVPKDRVAKLELPLSWLCSSANLTEPCKAGTTCQAGHCVDATVATSSLPEFEPSSPRDCYDVTECLTSSTFVSVGPITLESGLEVPCGIIGTKVLGSEADVNVALVVRNEVVGNYGFCGPFGECFIPLQRSAMPEGWRVLENGDIPAIALPPAVCENTMASISRVAVVRASLLCPSDLGDRPRCPPAQKNVCLEAPVCPGTSPTPAWVGYACTDMKPGDVHADLLKCWSPAPPAADGDLPDDGRWCCLRGQEASDDPLLIDDMQGGPQIKLAPPEGQTAGWWRTEIPEGSGDLSPAPEPSLYTYREFEEPVGPAGGPKFHRAACLSSKGFRGWLALQGLYFGGKIGTYGSEVRDVSEYAGISFWGWAEERFPSAPLGVSVSFPNVQTSHEPGSECITVADGSTRCDNFFREVALSAEWQHYVVRWEELAQTTQDWGQIRFDAFKPQIYAIDFTVAGAGPMFMSQPFDFCIADVRFEKKAVSP